MKFIDQKDDDNEFCYGGTIPFKYPKVNKTVNEGVPDQERTINFKDTCINSKSSNPFVDDGFVWCRLKEGYFECEFDGKWNECPDFKPVRAAFREMGIHYPKRHNVRRVK